MVTHWHHIIPKHAGGTDDPSNLVELTVEEHAEAHRKLFEQYGRWQDEVAWKGLSGQITKAEAIKEAQKKANLGNKHRLGTGQSNEYKKRLSIMMKERRKDNPNMGNYSPHKKETKKKISEAGKGNKNSCKSVFWNNMFFESQKLAIEYMVNTCGFTPNKAYNVIRLLNK